MSTRYPGGVITKTPVVPAGPYENGTAPGVWTLEQQLQAQKAGIWPTAGLQPNYIEDVFSTYLYTGTGASLTITNAIDLSTKGGLVWMKGRSGATNHALYDTARGATFDIGSNLTTGQTTQATGLTAFGSTGFTIGALAKINTSAATYVSWTFREQPKFFDVVTYIGTGANTTIAHNLGSVPGMIIVKRTDTTGAWQCYHRSLANTQYMVLDTTAAVATGATRWNSTTPTSSVFSLGTDATVNASAGTYVAYLFAHDAGGFGLTGTDNVISCGTFTTNGSGAATVTLGYEPQLVLLKRSSSAGSNWTIVDSMRGFPATTNSQRPLYPNLSDAESLNSTNAILPTSTGFIGDATYLGASNTFIYMAIRRGPMKVPTDATKVFGLNARTGTGANATVTGGQTADTVIIKNRAAASTANIISSRLTGTGYLSTVGTSAETAAGATILQANPWDVMDGVKVGTTSTITNASANTFVNYLFKRAPGFFDVVCWTGTGAVQTVSHNLGIAPELIIGICRSIGQTKPVGGTAIPNTNYLVVNTNAASSSAFDVWNNTSATATNFTVGNTTSWINSAGDNNIAYLFATCPGVSKVGSYTGNGTTQTINCGFGAGGARFVLIKRTDSTGDWYVYDTARGMTVLTDPYFFLNTFDPEVATLGSVTTVSTGFALNSTILAAINVSAGTYIFLAIA